MWLSVQMNVRMSVFQPLCYSDCHLFDEIHHNKASAALLTSRNEGNVLSVPPLETQPDIIGDLSSLTGVLGSAQWSLTTLCSLTHTGLHFQAQLISSLSVCSRAFSALVGLYSWNRSALKTGHKAWLKGSKSNSLHFSWIQQWLITINFGEVGQH